MNWQSDTNEYGAAAHTLECSTAELPAAYVEFWRRILTDASARASELDWRTVALQLLPREYPDDETGKLEAFFWDAMNRHCEKSTYVLACDAFVVLDEDEGDDEHNRDLIAHYLEHFERLRAAAAQEPIAALWQQANAIRPLKAKGAVVDGWVDLQIGAAEIGPLPAYDRQILAGQPATMQPDPGGLFDVEWHGLLNAVGAALVRYTPNHFQTIHCTARLDGNRIYYEIGCPDFPDEGTTDPSEELHQAMTRLIAFTQRGGSPFPGIRFHVEVQPDGAAKTHAELF
ncbi:MAG: hypothetical protein AB7K24_20180 [Gemmataceae bacterium]